MSDERVRVLEDQHDALAARVACLEEEARLLRKALMRPEVLERLGIIHPGLLEPPAPALTGSKEPVRQGAA